MTKKHRREWMLLCEEDVREASGYRASLIAFGRAREYGSTAVVNLVFAIVVDSWSGFSGLSLSEPRYRVLVGHRDATGMVGVAGSRTKRKAMAELARVDQLLATKTHDEVRRELDLDF